MKKIIATALSLIVGVFGYTIADKELSARVDDLELSVSSIQEEMSKTHNGNTIPITGTGTTIAIPTSIKTTIRFIEGYNYGYLKIKLPDFYNKKAELIQSDASNGAYMSSYSESVTLDGSEVSILIDVKNNSSGTLVILLTVDGLPGYYTFCECDITSKDGKIYLDDINYFDLSGLTTTTTTTTRIINEVTTK